MLKLGIYFLSCFYMDNPSYRKKGKPLSKEEKWLVVNVYHQCAQERKDGKYTETKDAHTRISNYTRIGRRQVVEIIRHYNETGSVQGPTTAGNRVAHQTNIPLLAEEYIRQLIFDKHLNGAVCTANHIQDLLKNILQRDIPHTTICEHLHRMGFNYSRTRKKTRSLRETQQIRQQRINYYCYQSTIQN